MKKDLELFIKLAEELLSHEENDPVPRPIPPTIVHEALNLELNDVPCDRDAFENILTTLVLNTPKTSSKRFFNQLFGGRKGKAVLGDLLAVLLNNSMYTYKVAGPMVGVEKAVLSKVSELIGYPATAGGTFASGGSMTNLMVMLMARDKSDSTIREAGINKPLIFYTSAESHYSIPKNAAFIGVGRKQVRLVPTDANGRMLANALDKQIIEDLGVGLTPCFVNATAGTTVLGAFDPLEEIAAVCKKHRVWLHVDGAYCGGVIFNDNYNHLVEGLDRSDSFSFNAHKMLNTPLTCSILVTRNKKHLYNSFSNEAKYLYQTDVDEFNLGKTSLQCGRRNDALKIWTLWKAIGTTGLSKMVEQQFLLADVARNYIRNNPDYTLYSFDDAISVCFNYKNIPAEELCQKLYEHAELMVGYGAFQNQSFVRLVTVNSAHSTTDILDFFRILEKFSAQFI